jgi:hypothetical protein
MAISHTTVAAASSCWAERYLDLALACRPEPAISITIGLTRAVAAYAKEDPAGGLAIPEATARSSCRRRALLPSPTLAIRPASMRLVRMGVFTRLG